MGKNINGAPVLLIQSSNEKIFNASPIRLRHLHITHDVDCVIYENQFEEISGQFSVISCIEADQTTEQYFLKIIEVLFLTLGESPDAESINQAIDQLIELFRALYRSPIKTIQGLWAELFLISESRDPDTLIDAWHNTPDTLYDFSRNEYQIEVKSTVGDTRKHRFGLAQLQPPTGTRLVIASILTKRTECGVTIQNLIEGLRNRLLSSPHKLTQLYKISTMTLGNKWNESALIAFDLTTARRSLAFFNPNEIPMVDPVIPIGVSDVHFLSDLTGASSYSKQDLLTIGDLIAASMPK